jgi:hypothetical protein
MVISGALAPKVNCVNRIAKGEMGVKGKNDSLIAPKGAIC